MRAITIYEDEEGEVFAVTGDSLTLNEGVQLLHCGIANLAAEMRERENDE